MTLTHFSQDMATFQPPRQQAPPRMPRRMADAEVLLNSVSSLDSRFRNRAPDEFAEECRRWAKQLDRVSLTLDQLSEGIDRAYSGTWRPDNPIGSIIAEARKVRTDQNRGRAVAELRQLSAAPPASGPVPAAYGTAVNHDCPACGAVAGDACQNPGNQGRPRFIPCVRRPRS